MWRSFKNDHGNRKGGGGLGNVIIVCRLCRSNNRLFKIDDYKLGSDLQGTKSTIDGPGKDMYPDSKIIACIG